MSPRTKFLSIVIATKDRPDLLNKCLKSLFIHRRVICEIVVVDSSNNNETKKICNNYKSRLPIVYLFQKKLGFSIAFNLGIRKTTGNRIALLNDDSVVAGDWSIELEKAIDVNNPDTIIVSRVKNYYAGNIYADIMADHYQNWIASHTDFESGLMDTLDNKAVIYPKSLFMVEKYWFDETLPGSEDIEFGYRLISVGKKIRYCPNVVIYHMERNTFKGFVTQHIRIARTERSLRNLNIDGEISLFPYKKSILNVISFLKRGWQYLIHFQFDNLTLLPILYIVLFVIRVWGYSLSYENRNRYF